MRRTIMLISILMCGVSVLCWILYPDRANSGPYLNSAHGNTVYGVNRIATSNFGYSRGNCAHCHEQHASINGSEPNPVSGSPSSYLLFADNFVNQSNNFCFYCHKGSGSIQTSFDRINYNYSYWFGGDTTLTTPNNIYDAFNPSPVDCCQRSAHNLQDILNFVKTKWPETFKDESNPCNACHNPHLAQRGYPVVRPTDRNNIWGDEPNEKMSYYASSHGGQYHAPYRKGGGYEPDGSLTTDGSNVPDYVTFCSDCHNATNIIYSSSIPQPHMHYSDNPCTCSGRNLFKIDWSNQNRIYNMPGDMHGSIARCGDIDGKIGGQWRTCGEYRENNLRTHPHPPDYYTDECETQSVENLYHRDPSCAADTTDLDNDCNALNGQIPDGVPDNIQCGSCYCTSKTTGQKVKVPVWWGALKDPYKTANYTNFILNCTDCHEPHGSQNAYLLRVTANSKYSPPTWNVDNRTADSPQEFCTSCHYHSDTTVSIYVPEFNLNLNPNGAHCGNQWLCLNCHHHYSVEYIDRCYACTYCPDSGWVHGRTF